MMTRTERLKFCVVCENRQMDINQGIICSLTKEYATFENECPNYIADETAIAKEAEKQKQLENSKKISGWLAFFLWVGLGWGGVSSLIKGIAAVVNDGWGVFFSIVYLTSIIAVFVTAIYAIWAFYNQRTNAVSIAQTYIGMVALDGLTGLFSLWLLNDGSTIYDTIHQFIWATIWFTFLIKSDDVDFLIPEESRTWQKAEKIIFSVYVGTVVILWLSIVQ